MFHREKLLHTVTHLSSPRESAITPFKKILFSKTLSICLFENNRMIEMDRSEIIGSSGKKNQVHGRRRIGTPVRSKDGVHPAEVEGRQLVTPTLVRRAELALYLDRRR